MHHVTISPKFQVVIPRVVRERLGLRPMPLKPRVA
jgi:AbrB family looped-hinge helix DNA binding protein